MNGCFHRHIFSYYFIFPWFISVDVRKQCSWVSWISKEALIQTRSCWHWATDVVFIWERDRDWGGFSTASHIHWFPLSETCHRPGPASSKNHHPAIIYGAFKVIILRVCTKHTRLRGLRVFIVPVNRFVLNGLNGKAHFSKRCHTHTSCYVVIVLTCKVPFSLMSEWAYATQGMTRRRRAPAREAEAKHDATSKQNLDINTFWLSLESDDDLSCASHQHWERLQCTAVCALHLFDTLTQ